MQYFIAYKNIIILGIITMDFILLFNFKFNGIKFHAKSITPS